MQRLQSSGSRTRLGHQGAAVLARVLLLIGRQFWKSGQSALADKHVANSIALLETLPPSRDLAMAYSARSQLVMASDQTLETLQSGQRELAHRLHLSAKTVDHHVSAILQKLDVHSRSEAVAAAFQLGIVKATDNGRA